MLSHLVRALDRMEAKIFWILQRIVPYEWTGPDYGWKEALFYPTNIETWNNHSSVLTKLVKVLDAGETGSLLDVGSGGSGFAGLIDRCETGRGLDVTLLDVSRHRIAGEKVRRVILGDSRCLPVKAESYDYVVSIDCEGILDESSILEMKRVAKRQVILHFPVDSDDGDFVGSRADLEFQKQHMRAFGHENAWTALVLQKGHPKLERLRELMPGIEVSGTNNADIWKRHMINSRRPVLRFFTGTWYAIALKRGNSKPPYRGCLVVYDKQSASVHQADRG